MNGLRNIYKAQDIRVSMRREVISRVFLIVMIGMLFIGMIGSVVGAEDDRTYVTKLGSSFVNFFVDWQNQEIGANVAKIIFGIIVGIGLFLLLSSTIDTQNKYTGTIIIASGLLSFLFTAYIAPAEIYSILNSYTALGLTLITLVPFGILGLLTWKAAQSESPSIAILQWLAWAIFAFYLLYRVIMDLAFFKEGSGAINISFIVAAGAALGIAIFNSRIVQFLAKKWSSARRKKASSTWQAAQEYLKHASESERKAGE